MIRWIYGDAAEAIQQTDDFKELPPCRTEK